MYRRILNPIFNHFDPETVQNIIRGTFHIAEQSTFRLNVFELIALGGRRFYDQRLVVDVGCITFDNPIMVGAGWDKVGVSVKALWRLGFSGVEVGSISRDPQPGNPRPRLFLPAPGVALNRFGFNTPGMEAVAQNLLRYQGSNIPIGVSVGKNKNVEMRDAPEAHAAVVRRLYGSASYFAINVSSPNTPGLRMLQEKGPLTDIMNAVIAAMETCGGRKPVFIKIAPDLSREAVDDVIEVAVASGATGIIATNTTNNGDLKAKYGERWRNEAGGLSGNDNDFRRMANEKVAYIFRRAGKELAVIGAGGVHDTATALEKIRAGASLVQVVTALRYEGLALASRINKGLVQWMEKEGIRSIKEVIGSDAQKYH